MKKLIAGLAVVASLVGCSAAPVAAGPARVGVHKGTASSWTVLGIPVSFEDNIFEACKDGKIDYIATVDEHFSFYLVCWKTTCVVTGETADEFWSHQNKTK